MDVMDLSGRKVSDPLAIGTRGTAAANQQGGFGIRVCIIEPGATATEIHAHIKDENVREATRQHVEKDGAMQPEDVAAAIVFVVSLPPRVNVSQLVIRPSVDARVL